ncbi:type I-E CRISPR-associated protein Cas6/Cse3/CasE [Acidomonas methanolica]|uniref:type I-E CRISPR-associated protein Cas6/Cse3/CasE n=1 Tax=Acidomonas methanolica TaxID=437 RepID=UPI00211A7C49|nr:type I-E CRISPR-associated protein Cas6/Cse3/CasE [Acidomonas methanolica]MCQ9156516.1 type I-E CRISPR-associated protein Cas6/Cse3/CasE [Acidomonas methanolica]
MTLYFSHIRLACTPSAQALSALLRPTESGERVSVQHRLLWSTFADSAERERDFLWREERDGSFLALSARPPLQTDLFQPHQVKPYAPDLAPGETLDFRLRANATRMKRGGKREDVVKASIDALEQRDRVGRRMEIASSEGKAWLERQGEKSGFKVAAAVAEDYSTVSLPRPDVSHRNMMKLGILDLSGRIEITDPTLFLAQMAQGFGRAKSFGCGLMLIRRPR